MKCQAEGLGTFPKLQHVFQVTWSRKHYHHFPCFHANDAIFIRFQPDCTRCVWKDVAVHVRQLTSSTFFLHFQFPSELWLRKASGKLAPQIWSVLETRARNWTKCINMYEHYNQDATIPLSKVVSPCKVVDVAEGERGPFRNPGDVLSACQEFNSRKAGDFFHELQMCWHFVVFWQLTIFASSFRDFGQHWNNISKRSHLAVLRRIGQMPRVHPTRMCAVVLPTLACAGLQNSQASLQYWKCFWTLFLEGTWAAQWQGPESCARQNHGVFVFSVLSRTWCAWNCTGAGGMHMQNMAQVVCLIINHVFFWKVFSQGSFAPDISKAGSWQTQNQGKLRKSEPSECSKICVAALSGDSASRPTGWTTGLHQSGGVVHFVFFRFQFPIACHLKELKQTAAQVQQQQQVGNRSLSHKWILKILSLSLGAAAERTSESGASWVIFHVMVTPDDEISGSLMVTFWVPPELRIANYIIWFNRLQGWRWCTNHFNRPLENFRPKVSDGRTSNKAVPTWVDKVGQVGQSIPSKEAEHFTPTNDTFRWNAYAAGHDAARLCGGQCVPRRMLAKSWHCMGTAISAFWGCFKTCEKKALRPGPGQGGNQPNQMQQHGATGSAWHLASPTPLKLASWWK